MSSATKKQWLLDQLPDNAVGEPKLFRAPGRVNIIGEHTDYTGGFVLPTTTAVYTWAAVSARDDGKFNVRSLNLDEMRSFSLDDLKPGIEPGWVDYVKGVAALLQDNDINLCGADIVIDSEIPMGGGLSSSAALEVVIATALLDLATTRLPAVEIAQLCQRAEIEYAGVNCGVMDQLAIACCERNTAMLLDCRNLTSKNVRLPEAVRLLLTDSGVKHALADGNYNQRTEECASALALLKEKIVGLSSLRDLSAKILEDNRNALSDQLYRRCRHVASENQRVLDTYEALKSADTKKLGALVSASHRSLREDFEVSCDEVDSLVQIADGCDGVFGSRMIGAGFGGCVLSVIDPGKIDHAIQKIRNEQKAATGNTPWMHIVNPTGPAKKITHS